MKKLIKPMILALAVAGLIGRNDYSDAPDGVIKKFGNAEVTKVSEPMSGKQWLFPAVCENTGIRRVNDCLSVINAGTGTPSSTRFHVSKEINQYVYIRAKFDDEKPKLVVPTFVAVGLRFNNMPDSFLKKARSAKKRIVIEYNHAGGETETVVVYNASNFNKAVDLFESAKI